MPTTYNILSNTDALLKVNESNLDVLISGLTPGWSAYEGLESATSTVISTNFAIDSRYVIEIFPQTTSDLTIELAAIPLFLSDNSRYLSFNCKIQCATPVIVTARLFVDSDESIEPNVQSLTSGQYNSVQSNRTIVADDENQHTATIRVTISGHSQQPIYFTNPHLIHDLAFNANPIIGLARRYLPDFYWEIDSAQESPTFPFFRFIDALSHAVGDTRREYGNMYGFEVGELQNPEWIPEYWTASSLVSPSRVRNEYIAWLGQFSGEKIRQNIQELDGEYYFQNDVIIRDFIEWQLRTSFYGRSAGTRQAMIEAARQVLIRTKDGEQPRRVVALTPNFGGDPFAIQLKTLTNETHDVISEGETSYIVLSAVEPSRPMGYKITHTTEDEFIFTLDDVSLGVLGANFPLE
jgi:hypothetical protein